MFQLSAYLRRIRLDAAPSVSDEGLRALHAAQFQNIAFENFDIHLGRAIGLDPHSLASKLVDRARGGYCFELNGLLLLALRDLGFTARPLLARVHLGEQISGRTHQLNLVELGAQQWIVDAGFGAGGPRVPLLLHDEQEYLGACWGFRLRPHPRFGILLQSLEKGHWADSYSFDLSHVLHSDLALGHHYTSTSPASHFTTTRVCSLPRPGGRISLQDFEFTRQGDGPSETRSVPTSEYGELLSTEFGIHLSEREVTGLLG